MQHQNIRRLPVTNWMHSVRTTRAHAAETMQPDQTYTRETDS